MSQTPLYDLATPYVGRQLMASLWRQSLQDYVSNDPVYGYRIQDDFVEPYLGNTTDASAVGPWWLQDSAAGGTAESFVQTAGPDGIRTLSGTTGTDHFGISVHYGTSATSVGVIALPSHGTAATRRGRVVSQIRVDLGTTGVGAGPLDTYFLGCTEPIVDFLSATSTLPTTSDYIGFYRYDGGAVKFVLANDNNGGTAVIDEISLPTGATQDGFNVFGFAVNPDLSVDVVVNGVWYGTLARTLDPLALPIELLTVKFETTRGPTGDRATVALPIDKIDIFVAGGSA